MTFFSQSNSIFLGYFDPITIILYNENERLWSDLSDFSDAEKALAAMSGSGL